MRLGTPIFAATLAASSVLALAGATACREPQVGPGPTPPVTATAPASARPSGPPLVLPAVAPDRASWLEPALDDAACPKPDDCPDEAPLGGDGAELVVVGSRAALVRSPAGLFAHHLERGLVGPLALPPELGPSAPPLALGLGTDDAVYLAASDGTLFRAADAERAVAGFERAGKVAGATLWDFVPGLVVAAAGDAVLVSSDEGKSFRSSRPEKGAALVGLVARADGVVVASTAAHTWISRDRGKQWKLSRLEGPAPHRTGSLLVTCGYALSSDGERWVELPADVPWDPQPWLAVMSVSPEPRGVAMPKMLTVLEPPAPPPPAQGDGQEGGVGCSGPVTGWPGRHGRIGVGSVGTARPFRPFGLSRFAEAPLGDPPDKTRSHFAFVGDGACAAADAAGPGDGYACKPGARFTRPPHLVSFDRTSGASKLWSVPATCTPRRIYDAMGAGVVVCDGGPGRLGLALVDPAGQFVLETGAAGDAAVEDAVAQIGDGSLLVATSATRGAERRVAVRRPLPLGAPAAWREVAVAGSVGYRLQPGGAVLAVVAASREAERFDLVLDRPDAGATRIAVDLPVEGGLAEVRLGPDGLVHVERRSLEGRVLHHVVDVGGYLAPATE
ncbi:MAG: hypothetical protein HY908_10980 [Myxococcales bacterium]|nr:hypothetical protein [Myxococcales bacterium]